MTQDEMLALLKTGTSIFLTGQPGSGKTHTVNRYVRELQLQGADIPRLVRELLFNLSSDKSGPTGTDDSGPTGVRKKAPQIRSCGYTAVPTMAPMAAVKPIASAPQNTTRMVGLKTSAPPVFAPIIPSKARKANDPTETTGSSHVDGERSVRMRGPAAPTENVAADASAACIGRAVLISEIPSSSRA